MFSEGSTGSVGRQIVADVNLGNHFGLHDGDEVEIRVPLTRVRIEARVNENRSRRHFSWLISLSFAKRGITLAEKDFDEA